LVFFRDGWIGSFCFVLLCFFSNYPNNVVPGSTLSKSFTKSQPLLGFHE